MKNKRIAEENIYCPESKEVLKQFQTYYCPQILFFLTTVRGGNGWCFITVFLFVKKNST